MTVGSDRPEVPSVQVSESGRRLLERRVQQLEERLQVLRGAVEAGDTVGIRLADGTEEHDLIVHAVEVRAPSNAYRHGHGCVSRLS